MAITMREMKSLNVGPHDGYFGLFTRDEVPGAIPNGTLVRKVKSEPKDTHKNGALASILGSISHPMVGIGYFVEWRDQPGTATFVAGHRIELAS